MFRILLFLSFFITGANAQDGSRYDHTLEENPLLPHSYITMGALVHPYPTFRELCRPEYEKSIPSVDDSVKKQVFESYGIDIKKSKDYQLDHLISIEIGGSNDVSNLWPQSYNTKPWNAHVKDRLENYLHREVCWGRMSASHAQAVLTHDWIDTYCIIFDDRFNECLKYRSKK